MPLPVTTPPRRSRPSLVDPNEIWLANGTVLLGIILNGPARLIPETDLVLINGCELNGCDLSALTWDQIHSTILRDCRLPAVPDGWPIPPTNGQFHSNLILTSPGRIWAAPADQEKKS